MRLNPAIAETTTVVAEPARINSTTQEVKQSLSAEQISDRPTALNINNNNTFLSLAETFAGFQENPTSGQNNPTASSGSSINFNGTGTRGATFQIDGVNNDDASENQNRQGVSLAAIKEFQVISNSYTAEFGRGYGAVVLVQTKSGTNQVRGEASFTRQDSEWNAMQAFATIRPNNQRPNYAGVVGFPVMKDKLFAFVSAEGGRQDGNGGYVRDLFTDAEKALPRLTRGNDTAANRAFQDSVLARFGTLQPNDSRSIRTFQTVAGFDRPTVDYQPAARLELHRQGPHHRPLSVLAAEVRQRGRDRRRDDAAAERSGELRADVDAVADQPRRRRVPVRSWCARYQREHQGGQRHPDHPVRRVARLRFDHRQCRQLSHPARSEGLSVRLQRERAASAAATTSRRAPT